jgi:hypothetical protein
MMRIRAVPTRSVELGRPRQAIEVARVDGDAGAALGGHEGGQGDEECCSSHDFDPLVGLPNPGSDVVLQCSKNQSRWFFLRVSPVMQPSDPAAIGAVGSHGVYGKVDLQHLRVEFLK